MRWTESLREAIHREAVALDGKALRRARDGDGDIRNIVSAWAESNRLVLGQFKMADKSNEITAVPELLRALELSGCSVTTDAMGCQKKIAREIIEADAHNHETAHEEVKAFLDEEVIRHAKPVPPRMACHWVLDVVMREDDSRTRTGYVAENLATLRRMTMNLLNRDKTKKRGIKGKQLNASWDHAYLLRLLDF